MIRNTNRQSLTPEAHMMRDTRFDKGTSFEPVSADDIKAISRENGEHLTDSRNELAQVRHQRLLRGMSQVAIGEGKHVKLIDASEEFKVSVRDRNTPPKHRLDEEGQ